MKKLFETLLKLQEELPFDNEVSNDTCVFDITINNKNKTITIQYGMQYEKQLERDNSK